MTDQTATARRRGLYALVSCLEGGRADLTPAEILREASALPGWTLKTSVPGTRPGTYAVDAGDGKGERIQRRRQLIPFLIQHWLPAARAELAKETSATPISRCDHCGRWMRQPATFERVDTCVCDYSANPDLTKKETTTP